MPDQQADIILTTINARYAHAAFGLRYLHANLGESLRPRARVVEFDVSQRSVDVLEAILAHRPRVVGVGVYIWNVEQATRLVADLKRVRPDVTVVLGVNGSNLSVDWKGEKEPAVQTGDGVKEPLNRRSTIDINF